MFKTMLLDFLKGLVSSKSDFVGVLPDNRTEQERAKDWDAEELASSATLTPVFRKVKKNGWRKYTVRDQDGSGSCVSQALAKGFEVVYKLMTGKTIVFSATPIYQKRSNRPAEGMYIHDAFKIAVDHGTCPESYCPSQKMTNEQMDAAKLPDNIDEISNFVDAVAYGAIAKDFDYVAGWVEKFGFVHLHIAADRKSWSRAFPRLGSLNRGIRHAIAVVDAVTYEGVQYLVIEDSWGEFGEFVGQRLLSREVFNDMYTSAAGFTVLQYDVKKKKFAQFTTFMEMGQRSPEIARLQDYMRSRGFFPSNIESTGFYGRLTALAVYNFQIARKVASPIVLNKNKGKFCHAATLNAINADL